MLVELDIFSGRPNPRWELDERTARRLKEVHRSLRPAATSAAAKLDLGYRGFAYEVDEKPWRALDGRVFGGDATLEDPDRMVERLLIESLPAELADLRERVAERARLR